MFLIQVFLPVVLFAFASSRIGPFDVRQDPNYSPAPPLPSGMIEGDIKQLTDKQKINLKLYKNVYGPQTRAASGRERERWPGAVIPYVFDCSVASRPNVISSVKEAMAEWEKRTCLRFVERTDEKNYLEFFRSSGCWASYVGYQNVKTQISVGEGCDYKHVMVHELGHVIGFWHEQSRPDRDYYIEIVWENVIEAMKYNFDKVVNGAVDSVDEPYDYASIMHYPFNAFSIDYTKDTIIPIQPLNGKTPYIELTDSDATQANRMYKCSAVRRERREALKQVKRVASDDNTCKDDHELCPIWAKDGCVTSANPLYKVCKKSCDNCGPCKDQHHLCSSWAKHGHCDLNPSYMWKHCKVSCYICEPGTTPTEPPSTNKPSTEPPTPEPTKPPTEPPTPEPPTPEPPTPEPPTPEPPTPEPPTGSKYKGLRCVDADDRCPEWASNGGCETNDWTKRNCMLSCKRTDLCDLEQPRPEGSCSEPFGLGWDRTIPDSAFQASTTFYPGGGWGATASNARLYMRDDHDAKRIGAWCSQYGHYDNQWLKVDLGELKRVSAVATQGRDRYFEHVEFYSLSFSEDGRTWRSYQENGSDKLFEGNCDNRIPVINKLSEPVLARYVKFHPGKFYAGICMRVEVYGCNA